MANPKLVEVTRGDAVESVHRGAIVAVNADGATVFADGDCDAAVYPRSSIKALQALPLVESGAADAYGFTDAELALACSSHLGEAAHVATVQAMLRKAGLDEAALECGPQWPAREADWSAMVRDHRPPKPTQNNCSGKHAGMLALACHVGASAVGYSKPNHTVQAVVRSTMEEMTGESYAAAPCGTDGCSIPTYAVRLRALAAAFARFGTGTGLAPARAKASKRLIDACFAHPEMVGGTGDFCTQVMQLLPGLAFVKTGAEGVFCATFPSKGVGVALKCDDGATRASEAMMTAVILHVLADALTDEQATHLRAIGFPSIHDRKGTPVGAIRWSGAFDG